MGKYTIQEEWPDDLKVVAANVIRAKLEKKWRKRNVIHCEDGSRLKYCLDAYMRADANVRWCKTRFEYAKREYQGES